MKREEIFIPLALALCTGSVSAQTQAPPTQVGQRIAYKSSVPTSVARLMPRDAKRLFWGTFTPSGGGETWGIHLFNLKKKEPSYNVNRVLGLYIFQMQLKGWKKANAVTIRYLAEFGSTDEVVDSRLLWLDSQEKIPLLKLKIFMKDGTSGRLGDEIAVVFPTGWRGEAVSQTWAWGSWFSSNSIGQENDWSRRDEQGNLQVVSTVTTTNVWQPKEESFYLWRGNQFRLVKTETTKIGPDGTTTIEVQTPKN